MTSAQLETVPGPTTAVLEAACNVCEHPLDDHDAIARRYCTATSSNALTRGCICS